MSPPTLLDYLKVFPSVLDCHWRYETGNYPPNHLPIIELWYLVRVMGTRIAAQSGEQKLWSGLECEPDLG